MEPVYNDCDWCVGLEVKIEDKKFIIIDVYMPYQCSSNEDNYIECFGFLRFVID